MTEAKATVHGYRQVLEKWQTRLGFFSHEGPVHEHEGEAVRGVVVAQDLPRHRLLVRHGPTHARHADTAREVCEALRNSQIGALD